MKNKEELQKLLKDIKDYNESIFNNTKTTEKIDFSKTKNSWGMSVIPKEFHINENKQYETECGYKVKITSIKLFNDNEFELAYPVKGYYIVPRQSLKDLKVNTTWTLDGRNSVQSLHYETLDLKETISPAEINIKGI